MDTVVNTEDWLKAMKLVDPGGHDKRVLGARATRYGVSLPVFLAEIQRALTSSHVRCSPWVWAVLNDADLMAVFDRYRNTTLTNLF